MIIIDIDCGVVLQITTLFSSTSMFTILVLDRLQKLYMIIKIKLDQPHSALSSNLRDSVFLQENISQMWHKWKELFFAAVHNNIKTRLIKKKRNVPWLTSAIIACFTNGNACGKKPNRLNFRLAGTSVETILHQNSTKVTGITPNLF